MQLATLAVGLISATALWSGVQALNEQARNSYDRAAAALGGARVAMLVAQQDSTFPQHLFVDLRRAGWPVSPVLEGRVRIHGKSLRLLGIEPVTFPAEAGSIASAGKSDLQPFLAPPGETLLAPETSAELAAADGAVLRTDDGIVLPPLKARERLAPGILIVDIGRAQRLLHQPDRLSRLLIGKARGPHAPLDAIVGDKLRYVAPNAETDLERLTDSFHLNLSAFGLLSFLVGLLSSIPRSASPSSSAGRRSGPCAPAACHPGC
jgi:putative ABC transport system permease protein